MKLAELQKQMLDCLYGEKITSSHTGSQGSVGSQRSRLSELIAPTPYGSSAELLEIYRGSAQAGLQSALSDIFPVCERLVGRRFFLGLVSHYLKVHPSQSFDIGELGACFPQFLKENALQLNIEELPYLGDVTQLELCWHQVQDQSLESAAVNNLQALSEVDEDQQAAIRFTLSASTRLVNSIYPIFRIWQANQQSATDTDDINVMEGGGAVFIWRDLLFKLRMESVSETVSSWMQALQQNLTLGEIELMHNDNSINQNASDQIEQVLPWLMQQGIIDGFYF
ncbi:MAG: DNA-binding domain-containing protein [Pseudomonadales bacterium]|nr:DNA-binding domain-containing protein [Pseudomonadales bacterium]